MFYRVAMFFINIYLRLKFKIQYNGKNNFPKKGGFIVCSNHISNYDGILICSNSKRVIRYFAKKELFETKWNGFWMKQLKAFPVDREGVDMKSLKYSINLLKEGRILGIFAQGTRVNSEEIVEAKAGVALFALKSGVDVVPIGISGNYKKGSKIVVNVGKPINFDKYKGKKIRADLLSTVTCEIMEEVEKLIEK